LSTYFLKLIPQNVKSKNTPIRIVGNYMTCHESSFLLRNGTVAGSQQVLSIKLEVSLPASRLTRLLRAQINEIGFFRNRGISFILVITLAKILFTGGTHRALILYSCCCWLGRREKEARGAQSAGIKKIREKIQLKP
jgi:hypothetical protein